MDPLGNNTSNAKITVSIAGITGWVGSALAEAILQHQDLKLIHGIARSKAGSKIPVGTLEVPVYGSLSDAFAHHKPDVLIDYTHASSVKHHVELAVGASVSTVVGSSGLSDQDYAAINALAHKTGVGVIAAGNFSITATLLKVFALKAARYLPHREIIEYSAARKKDAPNGTSREIAFALSETGPAKLEVPIEATLGEKSARGVTLNQMQVHSVRLPSFVSSNEVILANGDERLHLRQETGKSAAPYVDGTLLAVKKVGQIKGLIRGLERLMDL